MNILILITTVYCFFFNNDDVEHCHDFNGTSVIRMYIHLDELAIAGFASLRPKLNPLKSVMTWFGNLFDDINENLQKYGVQFHLDFSMPLISEFGVAYDKLICRENNPPGLRGTLANDKIKMHYKGEYGNHLCLFFCPNMPVPTLNGVQSFKDCNNTLGFLFGPLPLLKFTMKRKIYKAVFKSSRFNPSFNGDVCNIARKCITKEKSIFGKYFGDLKAVRHISNEKYILPKNERVEEHDLYDDIFVDSYKGDI
ncbi:hypothetical protein GVAV_002094 [Gurleya vavrai]